ncbi:MAG: uridine diphosphate-N-acetylglucosamine-binding protein YvcK [Acidimicrobiia bacterium]
MTDYGTMTDPLLQALEADFEGVEVVALGGGHGLATALQAIQLVTPSITAIVGVADNGGSSGRLSPALGIPPPGDLRRALVALTPAHSTWRDLFEFRFDEGDIAGHSLGNLMLAAMAAEAGSFDEGVMEAERCLGSIGSVVPAATESLTMKAVIDGKAVHGQLNIAQTAGEITELTLEPADVAANPRALAAIKGAGQIVLGPGSLFTSTLGAVAVPGMADAINASEAQLVYVCNLITQDGETLGMDGAAHIEALSSHGRLRRPDVIVANDSPIAVERPHEPVRIDEVWAAQLGLDVVYADLVDRSGDWPFHHPNRLGDVLGRIAPS